MGKKVINFNRDFGQKVTKNAQNWSKVAKSGFLRGFLGAFGTFFGHFWALLGTFWAKRGNFNRDFESDFL